MVNYFVFCNLLRKPLNSDYFTKERKAERKKIRVKEKDREREKEENKERRETGDKIQPEEEVKDYLTILYAGKNVYFPNVLLQKSAFTFYNYMNTYILVYMCR